MEGESPKDHYKIESWKKIALVAFFLIVVAVLAYVLFFSGGSAPFTGGFSFDIGGNKKKELDNPISIQGKIDSPSKISFEDMSSDLEVKVSGDSHARFSDQSVNFSDGDNVKVYGYEGKAVVGNQGVGLQGEASSVELSGINVASSGGGRFEVSSERIMFKELSFNNVALGNFEHNTSGQIRSEDNLFNLKNEKVKISNFAGSLKFKSSKINLDGKAEKLGIEGGPTVSVSN